MTRRPEYEVDFRTWLREFGKQVAARRHALGWTQAQAAVACGMDFKQYQDIEYGRRPPAARTMFTLGRRLGVGVRGLLPPEDDGLHVAGARRGLAVLKALGWEDAGDDVKFGLPVFDLQAAAGPPGDFHIPRILARLRPPAGSSWSSGDLFIAQVQGQSMVPLVHDGAWCLFRQPVSPPLVGKIVLARHGSTDDAAGAVQLKRVGMLVEDADTGVHVRLDSLNRAISPLHVHVRAQDELQLLGELIAVLDRGG